MRDLSRRELLRAGAALAAGGFAAQYFGRGGAQLLAAAMPDVPRGPRPPQDKSVRVLNPLNRVPLSFIIDDSTCLVNMGSYCMPQFAAAWPQRFEYKRPWRDWPREIPDAFVREFGEWCAGQGVRGKYSIVPYPACVGWLDRELPGWSKPDLRDSLKLVREVMMPNWDIHPEMVTHTRVIDLKTGRPMEAMTSATMENSFPQADTSADQFAAYVAYALQILKNCELPCEGITTPGGFGNRHKPELSLGVRQAVADVFNPEVPHYFKYVVGGDAETTQPQLEHVEGLDRAEGPKFIVNVPAGTGDWFGGWDGSLPPQGERYSNDDATAGRLPDLIQRGEPAILLCHWAGLYSNGTKRGFQSFQRVATAINGRFKDRTIWLKVSEIARYWAAKELTTIERSDRTVTLTAPVATPRFTLRIDDAGDAKPRVEVSGKPVPADELTGDASTLRAGTWMRDKDALVLCIDLAKGRTAVTF